MSWAQTSTMDERVRFIADHRSGLYTMAELCDHFGISRKTGYKWLKRFREEGAQGLSERSRAPHHSPQRMSDGVAATIVAARRLHPTWGARKLLAWLQKRSPELELPAASSAAALLSRQGLVKRRRRRRRRWAHPGRPTFEARSPNDLWTADFKGEFRTRDRWCCYPLTIADQLSRNLLAIQALDGTDGDGARIVFEGVFREAGLPRAIQTDNGSPFASRAIHGLTRLSVWWIQLGIEPLRIEPSHPEQNGAHERMHRTLKEETARPPAGNKAAQQRRFNRFRKEYNEERPHESLGQKPPATLWRPSPRPFPEALAHPDYPRHFEVRGVSDAGSFVVHRRPMFLSSALAGQIVGLEEVDDGVWSIYFYKVLLGRFDERRFKIYA